jgi:hypothetical protein
MTTTVQLDFAADSLAEAIASLGALVEAVPGLRWELAEAAGPAGWPLVAFTVPTEALEALEAAYGLEPGELA